MTRSFKRGVEFPHEGFVQLAIEAFFESKGYVVDVAQRVDLRCVHAVSGETWHVEAKGVTTQVGLDFRTGLGQLVQGMHEPNVHYGLAVPDTPAFRTQVDKVPSMVVSALALHWLFVGPDKTVTIVHPNGPDRAAVHETHGKAP
ncbi:hypothetical protein [Lysobacter humi (ex Lee et al. 2017)]